MTQFNVMFQLGQHDSDAGTLIKFPAMPIVTIDASSLQQLRNNGGINPHCRVDHMDLRGSSQYVAGFASPAFHYLLTSNDTNFAVR